MTGYFIVETEDERLGTILANAIAKGLQRRVPTAAKIVIRPPFFVGVVAAVRAPEEFIQDEGPVLRVGYGWLDDMAPRDTFISRFLQAEATGIGFYRNLRGDFSAARLEPYNRQFEIASNRLGTKPMFWAEGPGVRIWSPQIRLCLLAPEIDRAFDRVALLEGLALDNVLLDRTPFARVRQLPPATVAMGCVGKALQFKRYWHLKLWGKTGGEQLEQVEEGCRRIGKAVANCLGGDAEAKLYLSGGLDSRVILGGLKDQARIVESWSYGAPGCWDIAVALKLAKICGTIPRVVNLAAEHYRDLSRDMVDVSGGMSHSGHIHMGVPARLFGNGRLKILTGLTAGPIFGCFSGAVSIPQANAEQQALNHLRNRSLLTPDELSYLGAFGTAWEQASQDILRLQEENMAANPPEGLAEYIGINQRGAKLLIFSDQLASLTQEVRLPFANYDVGDFFLNLSPPWRRERLFEQLMIHHGYPELSAEMVPELAAPPLSSKTALTLGRARIKVWRWHQLVWEIASGGHFSPTNPLQKERQGPLLATQLRPWLLDCLDSLVELGEITEAGRRYFALRHLGGRMEIVRFRLISLATLYEARERWPVVDHQRIPS